MCSLFRPVHAFASVSPVSATSTKLCFIYLLMLFLSATAFSKDVFTLSMRHMRCVLRCTSHDQSVHAGHMITSEAHGSSEDPRGTNIVVFLLHLQPFVIHDMKSLMEGEQFINCKQIPNQEQQHQSYALTAGHGG